MTVADKVLMAVKLWPRRTSAETVRLAKVDPEQGFMALIELEKSQAVSRVGRRPCSIESKEAPVWSVDPEDTAGKYHPEGIPRVASKKRDKKRYEH